MLGIQHREFNILFSIMSAVILIGVLGFGLQFLGIIPIAIFFSTFPDIDQQYAPKEFRTAKLLFTTTLVAVFLLAIGVIIYFSNLFIKGQNISNYYKYIGLSIGILIIYILLYMYSKSKNGRFLFAHRGFTHTLILPILLLVIYYQLTKIEPTIGKKYIILLKILEVFVMGIFTGLLGHIFIDGTCKAGVPILFPITNKKLHWGNAITSDPKRPRQAHKSSIIMTKFWSIVCIIIAVIICFVFRNNIITQLMKLR